MKVIIAGCAPRSFEWPEGFEVWGLNACRDPEDRASRWFHLHGPDHIEDRHPGECRGGLEFLRRLAQRIPVYVPGGVLHHVPGAKLFPYSELTERFGSYFNSSFALLVAFAVLEGAEEIWLDGVRYGTATELAGLEDWSVPCLEHHLGIAIGRGVKVRTPPGSGLLGSAWGSQLYGYEGPGAV